MDADQLTIALPHGRSKHSLGTIAAVTFTYTCCTVIIVYYRAYLPFVYIHSSAASEINCQVIGSRTYAPEHCCCSASSFINNL